MYCGQMGWKHWAITITVVLIILNACFSTYIPNVANRQRGHDEKRELALTKTRNAMKMVTDATIWKQNRWEIIDQIIIYEHIANVLYHSFFFSFQQQNRNLSTISSFSASSHPIPTSSYILYPIYLMYLTLVGTGNASACLWKIPVC